MERLTEERRQHYLNDRAEKQADRKFAKDMRMHERREHCRRMMNIKQWERDERNADERASIAARRRGGASTGVRDLGS